MSADDQFDKTFKQIEAELKALHLTGDERNFLRDIIWVADSDHNVVYINNAAVPVLELTRQEIVGRPVLDFVHPSSKEEIEVLLNSILDVASEGDAEALGSMQFAPVEVQLRKKSGGPVLTQTTLNIRLNRDGKYEGLFGINRDITEQRALEQELRKNEALLRKVFETTPEAISVMDVATDTYLDVNEGFQHLTGWSRDEVIGKTPADLDIWVDLAEREKVAALLGQSPLVENFEGTFRRKDGSHVTGLMSITTFNLGETIHLVSTVRDISAVKQAREERAEMERQLLQSQKFESLGTLAGGIAHNFNNILMAIQGNASLLEIEADNPAKRNEYLRNIDDLIDSAAELTTELLAFGRPGTSPFEPVDLESLLREQLRLFGRTYPAISMNLRHAENLPTVLGDPGQINQVMMNLFVNARDAMSGNGSIVIHASVEDLSLEKVRPHEAEPGEYVHVSVRDTGSGIAEENLERIFDPFFTTKAPGKGTGLGLASVQNIIRNHRGFMTVESVQGEGTTFDVFLPVSGEQPGGKSIVQKKISQGDETILVVDDDPAILNVAGTMLRSLNYQVLQVDSGEAALGVIEGGAPVDLVLLDMIMPEMDGAETCRRLRALKPGLKVILSSGYHESDTGHAAAEFDGILQKPYKLPELSAMLRDILDR